MVRVPAGSGKPARLTKLSSRLHAAPVSLRIGIFVALLPPEHQGGAELQADRMAQELAARGHDVHVFARRQAGRPDNETRSGVHLHRRAVVPLPGIRLVAEVVQGASQAARVRPDVFLCYITMNSGLLGLVGSVLSRAPYVVWSRMRGESLEKVGFVERQLAFAIYRRAARIWVQSEVFVDAMGQAFEARRRGWEWVQVAPHVRVFGNGIDLPEPTAMPAAIPARRFLFVGRLVEEKNLPVLMQAARSLPAGAELWIAGDGPLRQATEAAAQGAPVRFLGNVPHERVATLLRESRALVLTSSREGMPNVVLEALAHGRPVIATPVGAIPDLVQDGVNGRLVPVGDAPALAAAMHALEDDVAWARMARAARPSVERFTWPRLVDAVEAELEVVVRERGASKR